MKKETLDKLATGVLVASGLGIVVVVVGAMREMALQEKRNRQMDAIYEKAQVQLERLDVTIKKLS